MVDNSEIFELFAHHVSPGKVKMYKEMGIDFVPGRREGCWIYDLETGTKVFNLRSSGGVFNLGHAPEETSKALVDALKEGIDMGDHLLISRHRAEFAAKLADLLPGDIQYCVFGVSGGEAVDLAIKLAKGYTQRKKIVSAKGGYHGHTGLALATGDPVFKSPFGEFPDNVQVPFNDVEALCAEVDETVAAVILETIQATAGVVIPQEGYMRAVRERCDEVGAVMIIDEVQAGLGRTGRLWAIDEWGVVPDIIVLGKGMSGGIYPLSATCFRPFLQDFFNRHPFIHISTAGGSDLACIVASRMLDTITDPTFLANVRERGEQFAEGLRRLQDDSRGMIREIRQRGLFIGIEFESPEICYLYMSKVIKNGLLALYANNNPSTLIVMPPLVITEEEVTFVLGGLGRAMEDLAQDLSHR